MTVETAFADSGRMKVDAVMIGAGMAGTCSALALARDGFRVALVDTHAVFPEEFKAEKLDVPHFELLGQLGLVDTARPVLTPMDDIQVYRFGRFVHRERRLEYAFAYSNLVNCLRQSLGAGSPLVVGRVASVDAAGEEQRVTLADGRTIEARLVCLSTGLGNTVRQTVGIGRREVRKTHSLSLAYNLAVPARELTFQTLTYYGFRRADRMAYVTLFPIGDAMRVNLFVYRDTREAWTKAFREAPAEQLAKLAPELSERTGGFAAGSPVVMRPIDLIQAEDYLRDGVVLLGDAFKTSCPAPGLGLERVLTDVARFRHHARHWLTTPGMGVDKIEQYYNDPEKRAMDRRSDLLSEYSRSIVLDDGPIWALRRLRNRIVREGMYAASSAFGKRASTAA